MAKKNTVNIAQYLVAKDNKTKYLKFEAAPNASAREKKLVGDLISLLGTDVLYVNLFDAAFREKYKVPEFVKGRIAVELKDDGQQDSKPETKTEAKAEPKNSGVDF